MSVMQLSNVVEINRLRPNTAQSDTHIAERWIRKELSGWSEGIVAQAISRAHRLIRAGKCWTLSADQAVKWARCCHVGGSDAA